MSDVTLDSSSSGLPSPALIPPVQEDERPPACPKCNKRLVILATHSVRDDSGQPIRQQLWGCPRGHATANRRNGTFGPVNLLAELVG